MKFVTAAAAIGALTLIANPAAAQDRTGTVQVKLLGTAVLPDGKITEVVTNGPGLPATLQTEADDNYVPTAAIEYFVSDNFSLETICCITQHDVTATTGLPGAELVSDAKLIPATLTAKYHLNAAGIRPYVGAGATYFLWVDVDPGAATLPLGVTDTKLSNEFGLVLQAGVDVPVNASTAVTFDAKRYFVDTTASWYVGGTKVIETEHQLDPWVVSAGVAFRF